MLAKQFTVQANEFQLLLDKLYIAVQSNVTSLPFPLQTVISPYLAQLYTSVGHYSSARLRYTGLFTFDTDGPLTQDNKILGPSQLTESINRFTKLYKIQPDTTNVKDLIDSLTTLEERIQKQFSAKILISIYTCCYVLLCNTNNYVTEDRASIIASIDHIMSDTTNIPLMETLTTSTKTSILDRLPIENNNTNSHRTTLSPPETPNKNNSMLNKLVTTPLKLLGLYPSSTPTGHPIHSDPLDDTTIREIMDNTFMIPLNQFFTSFEHAVVQEIHTAASKKPPAITTTIATATTTISTKVAAATTTTTATAPTKSTLSQTSVKFYHSKQRPSRNDWNEYVTRIRCKLRNLPYTPIPTDNRYLSQTQKENLMLKQLQKLRDENTVLLAKYKKLSSTHKQVINHHKRLLDRYDNLLLQRATIQREPTKPNDNHNNKNKRKEQNNLKQLTPNHKKLRVDVSNRACASDISNNTKNSKNQTTTDNHYANSPASSSRSDCTVTTNSSKHSIPRILSPFNEESTTSTVTEHSTNSMAPTNTNEEKLKENPKSRTNNYETASLNDNRMDVPPDAPDDDPPSESSHKSLSASPPDPDLQLQTQSEPQLQTQSGQPSAIESGCPPKDTPSDLSSKHTAYPTPNSTLDPTAATYSVLTAEPVTQLPSDPHSEPPITVPNTLPTSTSLELISEPPSEPHVESPIVPASELPVIPTLQPPVIPTLEPPVVPISEPPFVPTSELLSDPPLEPSSEPILEPASIPPPGFDFTFYNSEVNFSSPQTVSNLLKNISTPDQTSTSNNTRSHSSPHNKTATTSSPSLAGLPPLLTLPPSSEQPLPTTLTALKALTTPLTRLATIDTALPPLTTTNVLATPTKTGERRNTQLSARRNKKTPTNVVKQKIKLTPVKYSTKNLTTPGSHSYSLRSTRSQPTDPTGTTALPGLPPRHP
jgi:hypothetical protein